MSPVTFVLPVARVANTRPKIPSRGVGVYFAIYVYGTVDSPGQHGCDVTEVCSNNLRNHEAEYVSYYESC